MDRQQLTIGEFKLKALIRKIEYGKRNTRMKKIACAGTDGRTLLSALVTATAKSANSDEVFKGVVIRGTPSMPEFCRIMDWPVAFVAAASNSVED